jgi:UDPglucose 6-dehydrogenase
MNNLKVCVYGLGFVGNSMYTSFKNKGMEENINLFGFDKYKNGGVGNIDDGLKCDIIFMALPTMYNEITGSYDKEPIIECCQYLESVNYSGLIVIKSTVEPETTNNLSSRFKNLSFIHNPEFLTARTAYEDFHNQTHIVIGQGNTCPNSKVELLKSFYSTYYPNAEISMSTSLESESMKIFCNSFYAVKVQFFTELYLLTKSNGSDYKKIVSMMLKNNWINPMHTDVPGPDGQVSYGGLCFPKDTNALNKYMERTNTSNEVLEACIKERNVMRSDNDNVIKKTSKPVIKVPDDDETQIYKENKLKMN